MDSSSLTLSSLSTIMPANHCDSGEKLLKSWRVGPAAKEGRTCSCSIVKSYHFEYNGMEGCGKPS